MGALHMTVEHRHLSR